ncbi:MAG: phage holin family protein [Devosia sp.]
MDDPDFAGRKGATSDHYLYGRSAPELVSKLLRDVVDLFRKEGELIRSEMTDKITQLQVGVGKVAAGAVVLLVALIVLADALVVAVAEIIGEVPNTTENTGWAALIVGAFFAAVGAFLVRSGTTDLVPRNLTPDRTVDQVRRDTELAKDQVQ